MIRFRFKSNTAGTPQVYYRSLLPKDGSWETVEEAMRLCGISPDEMLMVDDPGGASRYGCVRCIIASDLLDSLYGDAWDSPDGGILFEWQETEYSTLMTMRVWLQPTRPIVWTNEGGFALVEARDIRWKGRFPDGLPTALPRRLSDDARYLVEGHDSMLEWCQALAADAGLTIDWGAFDPGADAELLAQDLDPGDTNAPGLMLDMAMAAVGWCIQHEPLDDTYHAVQIGDDMAVLGPWMSGSGLGDIHRGGVCSTAESPEGSSDLLDSMDAFSTMPACWIPESPWLVHGNPEREGDTRFNNQDAPDQPVQDTDGGVPTTDRPLADWRRAALRLPASFPADDENLPVVPWASPDAAAAAASGVYGQRATVAWGATVLRGWVSPPRGSYRQTKCRWAMVNMKGVRAPMTIVEAARDDWTLGASGELNTDPKGMVLGRGNAFPMSLWNGATLLRVAPPQARVFKARITGSTQRDGLWVWDYDWEEVEPDGTGGWAHDSASMRSSTSTATKAENTAEQGNVFGTFIWPGVTVADYVPNTVDCLPIANGGIVDMVNLAPTVYPLPDPDDERPPPYSYSFCTPNAPKVTCA